MKYEFQYTKILQTIIFLVGVCVGCILMAFLLLYLKTQTYWIYLVVPIFGIGLFRILRRYFIYNGQAQILENVLEIDLYDAKYKINFIDLISYKYLVYKNGPVLYLKTKTNKLRFEANNNFCKSESFEAFCEELINEINLYKNSIEDSL